MAPRQVDTPADIEWLPDLLRAMAQDLGLAVALRFAADFGGREITLPVKATAEHAIAQSIGIEGLEWLLRNRQPYEKLVVPLGPHSSYRQRIAMIRRLLQEGKGTAEIIKRIGCHERTVRRHRGTIRARKDQRDLFS